MLPTFSLLDSSTWGGMSRACLTIGAVEFQKARALGAGGLMLVLNVNIHLRQVLFDCFV
jgi:hypothetical protein